MRKSGVSPATLGSRPHPEAKATLEVEDVPAITTFSRREFDESKSPELTLFKYTPNSRGFIFLQLCAALLFIIAFTVYLITRFEPLYWMLPSLGLAGSGIYLIYLALYWSWFARRSGVGFDKSYLYIVRTNSVDRVAWRHLLVEAAGFTETHDNGDHGTLNMAIEGKKVQLKLFNPFVWVDDFPTFLVEMLSQIKSNESPKPSTEEAES